MSPVLGQSMDQLSSRARLFEYVGYSLAALAFAIIALGVLWSVGRRFKGRPRFLFTAISISVLSSLLLVFFAGLAIKWFSTAPLESIESVAVVPSPPAPDPPKTATLVLQVGADGSVEVNDHTIPPDEFPVFIEEATERWQQEGIRPENVTVEIHCDPELPLGEMHELLQACQGLGISQFRMTNEDRIE